MYRHVYSTLTKTNLHKYTQQQDTGWQALRTGGGDLLQLQCIKIQGSLNLMHTIQELLSKLICGLHNDSLIVSNLAFSVDVTVAHTHKYNSWNM